MDQTEINKIDLLEVLSCRSGCVFLSDLHQPSVFPRIRRALCKISPEQFSLLEWQDAIAYITGEQLSFENAEQAANWLKNYQAQRK